MSIRTEPLGRLTRWPLPAHDPAIDALSDEERTRVARQWARRIESEGRAIDGFTQLAAGLRSTGADGQVVALALRAVDDETRHTELTRLVASRYLGRTVAPCEPPRFLLPDYASAPPDVRPTLLAVALCCLQETTSSTYIEACLHHTTSALAHAALRELFTDEIDHARIGWAHLGSAALGAGARAAVAPWLAALARANFTFWSREAPVDARFEPVELAHGCGSVALGARAAVESTRKLIAPGFAHLGFVLPELQSWLDEIPAG